MQSQPIKRVVAGAIAAAAVITMVGVGVPAGAITLPALQNPPTNSADALAQYRAAAQQAEQLNEDKLKAQDDFNAKQADLARANGDLAAANQKLQAAQADAAKFQVVVDQFADASFVTGAQMNKLSALLTGTSAQDFLDRSSALAVLAEDKNRALQSYTDAVNAAAAAAQQATDARNRAQQATDQSQQLLNDLNARSAALQAQLSQLQQLSTKLSAADKAAQHDTGGAAPGLPAPTSAAQTAINVALGKLGSSYVWGATGPSTFDCSGLTQYAYGKAGISLPRTSQAQSTVGKAVPRAQLQPGDLVFFGSPVHHVGIYLGDGKMVHAPDTGDVVKISPLQNDYSGARRVAY
ncbi:cell wall-associated NlpC family hydrolase [Amycolatopsis bartoniae]|uniref:Hydrolase Nlp/P60 n=1 Tax=Amycolatopsis bartoniae TaxID=941986 RepID=A0A8H9IZY2_9PSEU|nr:C40 family peptidase [Amycolatopsis bartoniae]MBB2934062.1 cell wall-associated NlpC family hydrolase [Amycolatopsis bartoniae]TVT07355.1 NlpC/P60 family protein [Amycolatopsis bartoniae]GHF84610.1 hydrolase Nlp/P60 [Amycolatopsis bartoniae]